MTMTTRMCDTDNSLATSFVSSDSSYVDNMFSWFLELMWYVSACHVLNSIVTTHFAAPGVFFESVA